MEVLTEFVFDVIGSVNLCAGSIAVSFLALIAALRSKSRK